MRYVIGGSDYLQHYRTQGSKNGIRRYQYRDGSLTPLGREHYGVGPPRGERASDSSSEDTRDTSKRIKTSERSYDDLVERTREAEAIVRRMDMERKYDDLIYKIKHGGKERKTYELGKSMAARILSKASENILTQITTYALGTGVNKLGNELGIEGNIVNPKKGQKDK